jgi:hypothetical protein
MGYLIGLLSIVLTQGRGLADVLGGHGQRLEQEFGIGWLDCAFRNLLAQAHHRHLKAAAILDHRKLEHWRDCLAVEMAVHLAADRRRAASFVIEPNVLTSRSTMRLLEVLQPLCL